MAPLANRNGDWESESWHQSEKTGIVIFDERGRLAGMNRNMEDIFGLYMEHVLGIPAMEFITMCISPCMEHGQEFAGIFENSIAQETDILPQILRMTTQNTGERAVEYSSHLLSGPTRHGVRVDLYRLLPEPTSAEGATPGNGVNRVDPGTVAVLEAAGDPIALVDADGTIPWVNSPFIRTFGIHPRHVADLGFWDAIVDAHGDRSGPRPQPPILDLPVTGSVRQAFWIVVSSIPHSGASILAFRRSTGAPESFKQLEHRLNALIEACVSIGDTLRNHLQVLLGEVELGDRIQAQSTIDQIQKINEILRIFDYIWLESDQIREDLRRQSGGVDPEDD
ncbi:MAG: PAS domain-containing protein [Methanomicrobiales archaeon]